VQSEGEEKQSADKAHPPAQGAHPKISVGITAPVTEKPGDRIGRYRLIEEIGHGGCGVVYMADQEEPVRRRVALKVIKLGMDTKQVVARFEAERQALALMDHPNIARVLDAGATATGRPYFVMELVSGIKITDYCEQNNLTTPQRLDLFIQVCRALQHAHQKGVIHRDIKPSNVLVAVQDGVPVPKVIDFGIAKATQGKLTDQTVFTAFEQFLGTPAYMSPEQAQLGGLDVDTRSDIYSLGVLLYELLTGKTPFDAKELLAAGLEAMRRTIQEKEPPTPSTRLKQNIEAQRTQTPSESKIKNQKSKIANDLDWIVMKCLEKDRARRYETANGLARDIERHLSNEPVLASPPSNMYRLQKLVRRNRVLFAAAGAVSLALVLGLGLSTWLFFRERAARGEQERLRHQAQNEKSAAQTEAAKSQQVATFLQDMLEGVGPSRALGRDTTMLKEILDRTAERVGKDLTNQPEVAIELRDTLADTYMALHLYQQMADVERENLRLATQHFGPENKKVARSLYELGEAERELGHLEEAEMISRKALALVRKLFGNEHRALPDVVASLATTLRQRGKLAEAESLNREALAISRKVLGSESEAVAYFLDVLGGTLYMEGKLAEAESVIREGLAIYRKLLGDDNPYVAASLDHLSGMLWASGKPAQAEPIARQALAMRRKIYGLEDIAVADSLNNLAPMLHDQRKLAEAEAIDREALAIYRKRYGPEHPAVATSMGNLAAVLEDEGKLAEAEALSREALTMRQKLLGNEHPEVAASLATLANVLTDQNKFTEAEPLLSQAVAMRRKLLGDQHPDLALDLNNLAVLLEKQGKFKEAEALGREELAHFRAQMPSNDPLLAGAVARLSATLLAAEKFIEAETTAREYLQLCEQKLPENWRAFDACSMLGASLAGQGKYAEAEPLLVSGYQGIKQRELGIPRTTNPPVSESIKRLARLYELTNRADQAAEWKKKLEEFERAWKGNLPAATLPEKSSP
jgi:serine/threonine protein kinase/tetratricopeptide (TPR) repeat protein